MKHVLPRSRWQNLMKYFRANNRFKVSKFSDVLGTESVPETLQNFQTLTRLSAREDLIVRNIILAYNS